MAILPGPFQTMVIVMIGVFERQMMSTENNSRSRFTEKNKHSRLRTSTTRWDYEYDDYMAGFSGSVHEGLPVC